MVPDLATSLYVASAAAVLSLLAHFARTGIPRFAWPKFKFQVQRQRCGNIQVTDVMLVIANSAKPGQGLEISGYLVIKRKF